MAERKVSIEEAGYYLSAWGNENIIRNHVAYFEKKTESEINEFRDVDLDISLANFPNFSAWIRLYAELICNSLYWRLFRHEGDWEKIRKLPYGKVKDIIINRIKKEIGLKVDKIEENELHIIEGNINLILNLRHSFQHGGLPNLMRDLSFKINEEKFFRMLNPKNYEEIKKIFLRAEALIKLLPQPVNKF